MDRSTRTVRNSDLALNIITPFDDYCGRRLILDTSYLPSSLSENPTTEPEPPFDPRGFIADGNKYLSEILTLSVGPKPKKYAVHQDLLCEHSPFFQASVKEDGRNKPVGRGIGILRPTQRTSC